jgi:hypothetical protein
MKTVVLWVVLIILFVAFYQVFSQPPPEGGSHEPAPSAQWSSILANWLPIVFLFLFFIFFMRRLQSRHAPTHEGVKLLGQGRYVQALEIFEKYRQAQPNEPAGAFNSGSTKLQLWKLDAALADLESARAMAKGKVAALTALLPEHLALVQALLGREASARQNLKDIPADQADPGRIRLAEAILLARSGDAAGARAKLSSFEVKQMAGTIGALARTLDAMCVERLTGELRHVDRIALFGETGPDGLRKAWPELISFVERAPAW